ncbi:MAG: hypothetical protein JXR05_00330 [Flavobacteriaceae bacterium]
MNSTRTLKSIVIALLILLGLSVYINRAEVQKTESFCSDFSKEPRSTLETGLIGDMVSIYRDNQLRGINTEMRNNTLNPSYKGIESILFDLEIVSKFIYHIKQGVYKNSKNPETERLGLRFYYAAYPEKAKWGRSGYIDLEDIIINAEEYQKKHTLVILATRVNSDGVVVDFDPFDKDTYEKGLPKYTKPEELIGTSSIDQSPEAQKQTFSLSSSNTGNSNTFSKNHGQLYPPYTSTGIAF